MVRHSLIALIFYGILTATAAPQEKLAQNVSGYWKSKTAVYQVFQKGEDVLALYDKPDQEQRDSGIKPGDVAFTGTIVGSIFSGDFYHKFPLDMQRKCPANWYTATPLYLTLSADGNTMEGDIMSSYEEDNCTITDRRFDHFKLERIKS
jgi:hypothetical protein